METSTHAAHAERDFDPNKFDQMLIDVDDIYARVPLGTNPRGSEATRRRRLYRIRYGTPLLPLHFRRYLSCLLRQTHLDVSWVERFAEYWSSAPGGRPLGSVHDLYFLNNVDRAKFQRSEAAIEDTPDASLHLRAWQRPEARYPLLHLSEKEALYDHAAVFRRLLKFLRPRVLLEFGCGTAPILTSMRQFGYRSIRAYIADVKTHYGAFKFADDPNVTPILLEAESEFSLPPIEPLDAIFCLTVFEHLNRPLATAQALHRALRPGGVLVFDYVRSEGGGPDTHHGVRERRQVLDFISANFEILEGSIDPGKNTSLTFARRRG